VPSGGQNSHEFRSFAIKRKTSFYAAHSVVLQSPTTSAANALHVTNSTTVVNEEAFRLISVSSSFTASAVNLVPLHPAAVLTVSTFQMHLADTGCFSHPRGLHTHNYTASFSIMGPVSARLNVYLKAVKINTKVRDPPSLSFQTLTVLMGVKEVVRGLEGIHLADSCILTRLQ
jgi:hypothetical protein